jgi:hypothetical protein
MMNYIEIKGDNYELGRQIGKWWGEFFQTKQPAMKHHIGVFLKKPESRYILFLQNSWNPKFLPLLRKTRKFCPDIMEEIYGMTAGVSSTGLKTSFLHMFGLCLAETGARGYQCSSFVMNTKQGFIIGHNEECDSVYPMLLAKVTLKQGRSEKRFISLSYPFQLLCSGVGMNARMAFQGNSIGCYGKIRLLERSWNDRLPKTVLTRKMAELDQIEGIKTFYREYATSLPSHHYIIYHNKAYSLDVAPGFTLRGGANENIIRLFPVRDLRFHTNHFLPDSNEKSNQGQFSTYREWKWSDKNKDSEGRFNYLQKHLPQDKMISTQKAKVVLLQMAKHRKYCPITSATSFMEITKAKASCESHLYFGDYSNKKITL